MDAEGAKEDYEESRDILLIWRSSTVNSLYRKMMEIYTSSLQKPISQCLKIGGVGFWGQFC